MFHDDILYIFTVNILYQSLILYINMHCQELHLDNFKSDDFLNI